MKLKEFARHINTLLESHPEAGELLVVTTAEADAECGFEPVYNAPSAGSYSEEEHEFLPGGAANAICIN